MESRASSLSPRRPESTLRCGRDCLGGGGAGGKKNEDFHRFPGGCKRRAGMHKTVTFCRRNSPSRRPRLCGSPGLFLGFPWSHFLFLRLERLGRKGLCLGTPRAGAHPGDPLRPPSLELNLAASRGSAHGDQAPVCEQGEGEVPRILNRGPGQDETTASLIS